MDWFEFIEDSTGGAAFLLFYMPPSLITMLNMCHILCGSGPAGLFANVTNTCITESLTSGVWSFENQAGRALSVLLLSCIMHMRVSLVPQLYNTKYKKKIGTPPG